VPGRSRIASSTHIAIISRRSTRPRFPKELCDDFRILNDALTRERPLVRGDDALRATIRKMSNDEAEEVATWIVKMFCALQRPPMPAQRDRANSGAQVVPLLFRSTSRG
jgi:hypothetical protein